MNGPGRTSLAPAIHDACQLLSTIDYPLMPWTASKYWSVNLFANLNVENVTVGSETPGLTDSICHHYWQKSNLYTLNRMTLRPRDSTSTCTIWGSTFCIKLWWDELFPRKEWTPNLKYNGADDIHIHVSWKHLAAFIVSDFLIVITHKYKESVLISINPDRAPHSSSSSSSKFHSHVSQLVQELCLHRTNDCLSIGHHAETSYGTRVCPLCEYASLYRFRVRVCLLAAGNP